MSTVEGHLYLAKFSKFQFPFSINLGQKKSQQEKDFQVWFLSLSSDNEYIPVFLIQMERGTYLAIY